MEIDKIEKSSIHSAMNEEIQTKINELKDAIKQFAPKEAVAFDLFMNDGEIEAKFRYRTAKSLKEDGISMRNLAGEFIK